MSKLCPNCRKAHPAIKDAAGRIVILPHMADGSKRKDGQTCKGKP